MSTRPPLPPFSRETAVLKVRLAEDGWNSRDPEKVAQVYSIDSRWRNRAEFVNGRAEIVAFLTRKWAKELDYRLIKELWAFTENRIAVRFAYEWHDDSGLVSIVWKRKLGIQSRWADADEICVHQRSPYQGIRSQIPLAARPPSRPTSRTQRSRILRESKRRWLLLERQPGLGLASRQSPVISNKIANRNASSYVKAGKRYEGPDPFPCPTPPAHSHGSVLPFCVL